MQMIATRIGTVRSDADGMSLALEAAYIPALQGLEGFSHIQVLWWFSECDDAASRNLLTEHSPYKGAPETMGVFATRSPRRPTPVALSCAAVTYIDAAAGIIGLDYIDAADGTPVIDIKPYTPSADRISDPSVPVWCAAWPKCREDSGRFDWSSVFNF